jgi:DNA-directed RNA polymerase subunit E'/Rpb7
MTSIIGPYINTILESYITLEPIQMNNNIYKNLKDNLVRRFEGRCMKDYGFISKIHEIVNYSDGYIVPENPKASATFKIKFSCKLCFPLKNKQLVCKISEGNKLTLRLVNGPINVIITMDRINKDVFYQDPKSGLIMFKKNGKSEALTSGKYVKVTVETRTFNDMDSIIMAMGFLDDIASEPEIKQCMENEFGSSEIVSYESFVEEELVPEVADITDDGEEQEDEETDDTEEIESESSED